MKFNVSQKFNLDRKLRKLKKNPKLFFKDMVFKRKNQLKENIPIKYQGKYQFTIVSAVYNVEKYLDEYFESITTQSLNFKEHIFIICVDDGSTDSSAMIIKKWQKKYPKNIQYIYKENGGQASARNLGLPLVKTDWVTFIDSDDMINKVYFQNIDTIISKHYIDLALISCAFIFYFEDLEIFKDSHPLKYRFKKNLTIVNSNDLKENLQLSVNSAIFRTDIIKHNTIRFDERIKPSFEDARFVLDYLVSTHNQKVIFTSKDTQYLYRKRSDTSSTLDTSWQKPTLFSDVLEHGCLTALESAQNSYGFVPYHIQKTILYHYIWYIKRITNNDSALSHLDETQIEHFLNLSFQIFQYIDAQTILEFNLAGCWFFHKVGILGFFKKQNPSFQIAYIENIDREKKQVLIYYFSYFNHNDSFKINNIDTIPSYQKTTKHTFLSNPFVLEKRAWIQFKSNQDILTLTINNQPVRLTLAGKQHHQGVSYQNIFNAFKPSAKYHSDDSWLFMDRDTQADDNAEHLYRYVQQHDSERKICFALRKDSNDWDRLNKEGFNLVDFGSSEFETALRKCSKIISSHLDQYISNYFNDEYEYSKKFIFLQHGVIQNNLSHWLNSKKNLQLLVTTTTNEYQSIVKDKTSYKLTPKEVQLVGLSRHDNLLKNNLPDQHIILLMPTWRKDIVGNAVGKGNTREINTLFFESQYAQHWSSLLSSKKLKQLVEKYNYKVIFAPHLNITPYLKEFNIPKYIEIWESNISTMQNLFQNAKIMITDYSSVAFEMGVLEKLVIYYQFDYDNIYSGNHITQQGYFDYSRDGFGPIVFTESNLLIELEKTLNNAGKPSETYLTRMQTTFPFRDGKNCERIYRAILALDEPEAAKIDISTLKQYIKNAELACDWELLKFRSLLLIEYSKASDYPYAKRQLTKALLQLNNSSHWKKVALTENHNMDWEIINCIVSQQWNEAIKLLNQNLHVLDLEEKLWYIQCHANMHMDNQNIHTLAKELTASPQTTEVQKSMIKIWLMQTQSNWLNIKNLLLEAESNDINFEHIDWWQYKPFLILANAYYHLEEIDLANEYLNKHHHKFSKDPDFYIEKIKYSSYST